MPRRNDPKDAPADFDELLAEEPAAVEVQGTVNDIPVGEPEIVAAPALTPAQERLAAARAKAAERAAAAAEAPILTEEIPDVDQFAGLTPEEIEDLKALEDEEARLNNARLAQAEKGPDTFDNSRVGGTGETIVFHVLIDGVTAFGNVWYRGQEIEIEKGTAAYKRTLDKHGNSWLDIIGDEHAQYARWGERKFGVGTFRPLPGEKFEDDLVREDARRRRTVPIVASV